MSGAPRTPKRSPISTASNNIFKGLRTKIRGDSIKTVPQTPTREPPASISTLPGILTGRTLVPSLPGSPLGYLTPTDPYQPPAQGQDEASQALPLRPTGDQVPLPPPPPGPKFADLHAQNDASSEISRRSSVGPLALNMCPLTFAVDVSGSTSGEVLQEEQSAIRSISSMLELPSLAHQSTILPWSHKTHSPVDLADVGHLRSGGGTNPAALLKDSSCATRLQSSQIWFLMTDGFIDETYMGQFASGISKCGIHGTASVIILFGNLASSPFDCNVSVGISVFAVAPHCIFLFHDVKSSRVYVFQAKGCFLSLLPEQRRFMPFGLWTRWEDLVQITYEKLAEIKVPAAVKLSQDTVLLPDGRQLSMDDIYNDTLPEADRLDLLADYGALDVIILAARTRGRDSEVKTWISNARTARQDPRAMRPEDIGGRAKTRLVAIIKASFQLEDHTQQPEKLWQHLRTNSASSALDAVRADLRSHHWANWGRFWTRVEAEEDLSSRVNETVRDVVTVMEQLSSRKPDPIALTPTSSPRKYVTRPKGYDETPSPMRAHYSTSVTNTNGPRRPHVAQNPRSDHASQWSTDSSRKCDRLFLPGFKGLRCLPDNSALSDPSNYDFCCVCGQRNSIQTLLLQPNSASDETPHLPPPGKLSGHMYPMVLGNYPETDVILPITSCDACAFTMLEIKDFPNSDRVSAALPLVSLDDDMNRLQWLETLKAVYENRFREDIVLPVFLSSICSTIEDLLSNDEPGSSVLIKSLEWCCRAICRLPSMTNFSVLTPIMTPISGKRNLNVDEPIPLEKSLRLAFNSDSTVLGSPFLSYPIGGFVVIVRLACLLEDIEQSRVELFVWKRLLYHLVEAHQTLQTQVGQDRASEILKAIVCYSNTATSPAASSGEIAARESRKTSLSLSDLTHTYLFSDDSGIVDQFQRMGEYFAPIETTAKFNYAMGVFLHLLAAAATTAINVDPLFFLSDLRDIADVISRSADGLYDIFSDPTLVREDSARTLIEEVYKMHAHY